MNPSTSAWRDDCVIDPSLAYRVTRRPHDEVAPAPAPVEHKLIGPDNLGRWGFGLAFQARCSCRLWESPIEATRPDAIRHHTMHRYQATAVYA